MGQQTRPTIDLSNETQRSASDMGPETLSSTTTIEYNNQIVDRVEHVCSVCVSVSDLSHACAEERVITASAGAARSLIRGRGSSTQRGASRKLNRSGKSVHSGTLLQEVLRQRRLRCMCGSRPIHECSRPSPPGSRKRTGRNVFSERVHVERE